ncbi:MAG: nucleotidyltransferase domain-containing protein [Deltaproteobacteria bacterium]|nr:nucleotidyltransferase domain-containing protein [Deltaproteobacteria bacterium]
MRASANPPWEITPEKVESAIRKIIEVGKPRKIILFGSYVRNAHGRDSDVDFLVVVGDEVENPRKESVRIREALGEILMPMDLLVVPFGKWQKLKDVPGLIYRDAQRTGEVVYESRQ